MLSDHSKLTAVDSTEEEKIIYPEIIKLERIFEDAKQDVMDMHLQFLGICITASESDLSTTETAYKKALTHWADVIRTEKNTALAEDEKAKNLTDAKKFVVAVSVCKVNNERWALINKHEKLLQTSKNTFETINKSFGYVKPVAKEEVKEQKNECTETAVAVRSNTFSSISSYYYSMWRLPVPTLVTHVVSKVSTMISPFRRRE